MNDIILVLGMHRSGTSSVTGILARLGCALPESLMSPAADNPTGFFESFKIVEFSDALLEAAGSNWRDWRPINPAWYSSHSAAEFRLRAQRLLRQEFNGSPLSVFKDPRACRCLPFWLDVLGDMKIRPHVVMPIRFPLDVAQSLTRRNGLSSTHGLRLWLRHVLDAEANSRGITRTVFAWEHFLSDWQMVCDNIASDAKLSWPRLYSNACHDIEKFLDYKLVHHKTERSILTAEVEGGDWALRAYQALLSLASNASRDLATLDEIRAQFDQFSRTSEPLAALGPDRADRRL